MMQINKISTGSSGNAIVVDDGHSRILLDAGISYRRLSRSIRISDLSGVFITHEHGDHSKAVQELCRRGVDVYMSPGTAQSFHGAFFRAMWNMSQARVGSWDVLSFNVPHDAAEPLGFLFSSRETGEKGVYICDSSYVQFDFKGITHWIIECNYSEELLDRSEYNQALKNRIRHNHFSFENLQRFITTSDLSQTEEIHLVHLSDSNSDEKQFITKLQRVTGVPVYT